MVTQIRLRGGMVALIDDDDADTVRAFGDWGAWNSHGTWYAISHPKSNGRKSVLMHRLILGALSGQQVDHADHDGLNNVRANLRLCNNQQNQRNRRKKFGTSSVFKGVSWHKRVHKWVTRIKVDQKLIHLGYFGNETEAAEAYNAAAVELFGEFALVNVIDRASTQPETRSY